MRAATTHDLARRLRSHALRMTHRARASHIGSSLSIADILAVLYGRVLRFDAANPEWPERDRLVVSKGHAAAILYAALAESGYFPLEELETYSGNGSRLAGHVSVAAPGVEVSTGSLGHGLPIAAGMALATKGCKRSSRVFALLSDGELDEGSNWEAIQFAQHARLANLVAIVDYNKIQSFGRVADISDLEPLAKKFEAFNWGVAEIDGHDHRALEHALASAPVRADRPTAIIAHTVKGKGVSFMENELAWHYRNPDDELLRRALAEIGADA